MPVHMGMKAIMVNHFTWQYRRPSCGIADAGCSSSSCGVLVLLAYSCTTSVQLKISTAQWWSSELELDQSIA